MLPEPAPEPIPESARYELIPCPSSECLKLNGAPETPKYDKTCCQRCGGLGIVPAPGSPNPLWENALRYMRRPFLAHEKKRIRRDVESTTMQATAKVWAARRERALLRLRRGTREPITSIKADLGARRRALPNLWPIAVCSEVEPSPSRPHQRLRSFSQRRS